MSAGDGKAGEGDRVADFTEKVHTNEVWINGGFFVLEPEVLDYIEGDHEPFERGPLTKLAHDGELMAFKHYGFWHPMDNSRDYQHLNGLWGRGEAPWACWQRAAQRAAA